MNTYRCSCHIDGESYDAVISKCVDLQDALSRFKFHLSYYNEADLDDADGIVIDKVEGE